MLVLIVPVPGYWVSCSKDTSIDINAFSKPKRPLICCLQEVKGSVVAWWLVPRNPDPEVGGSSPTRVKPCCVLEQGTFTPQKYW